MPAESTSQTSIDLGDQDNSHFRVQLWTSGGHLKWELDIRNGNRQSVSGSRRESHPPAPTDPGVTISRHRALVILAIRIRARMRVLAASACPPNSSRKPRFRLIERTRRR